uniref:Choline-specific glycerophosphodiester phosphodiesterase n=1 Tax=Macrostomum lignano TaxID=282301 RepID=A0A1I8GYF9_9PLAT
MLMTSALSSISLYTWLLIASCRLPAGCHAISSASSSGGQAPLFVLLLDGLRWDYPLDSNLTGFSRLRQRGASVLPLRPVYPSLCLPNIYSMFTDAIFNKSSPGLMSLLHTELGVETLWDSLSRVGRRSLLYYLPGCAYSGNYGPSVCARPYRTMAPLEEVQSALLEGAKSMRNGYADLVVLYVDLLDWGGHRFGPESATNRRRLLRQIDVLVSLATKQIVDSDWGASAGAHLLVIGDHGMSGVVKADRADLQNFAKHSDVLRVVHLMQSQHPHVEVLTDAQLVSRFYPRVANQPEQPAVSARLPPISLLAEPGIFLFQRPARGWHGYDPVAKDMHTAVLVAGPLVQPGKFLSNATIGFDAVESLDVYPLMRRLLGLKDSEQHYRNRIWRRQSSSRLLGDLLLKDDDDPASGMQRKHNDESAALMLDRLNAKSPTSGAESVICRSSSSSSAAAILLLMTLQLVFEL